MLITDKEKLQLYDESHRSWQGIPGIERTGVGVLYATFYSGMDTETYGNYCLLVRSFDDGASWSEPIAAADAGKDARCYDPCLWIDPLERLWFFWAAAPDNAVWGACCSNPDAAELQWSVPLKIGGEIMMNKPIVLKSGKWLLPCAVWRTDIRVLPDHIYREEGRSFVYTSDDNGETFERLGGSDVPERSFDEHMVVELEDGRLWMLVRTFYGIGQSFSSDSGKTWSAGENSGLGGPNSRFHIRRTPTGRLLLINHCNFTGRNNLTAMLSDDEGKTWKGYLMIDERDSVSYPDAAFGNGFIYIIYDRERGAKYNPRIVPENCAREILMAKVCEEDILAGKLVNKLSRLKIIVSKIN